MTNRFPAQSLEKDTVTVSEACDHLTLVRYVVSELCLIWVEK